MGHLLSSVNKVAADSIQPDMAAPNLPDVGHIVVYTMRQPDKHYPYYQCPRIGASCRTRFYTLQISPSRDRAFLPTA